MTIAAIAGLVAIASRPRPPDDRWLRFSIGPASGENAWISGGMIRSNGIALLGAIATAYDIPADLARALQSLLGRPVVDETGITGTYNLQLEAIR